MLDFQKVLEFSQDSANVITSPYAAGAFYLLVAYWLARRVIRAVAFTFSLFGKLAFGLSPFFLGSVLIIGGLGASGFGFGSLGTPWNDTKEKAKLIDANSTPQQIAYVKEVIQESSTQKETFIDVPGPISGALVFSGIGMLGIGFTVLVNSFDKSRS